MKRASSATCIAIVVIALGAPGPSFGETIQNDRRVTVSFNDRTPTPDEIERALFPKDLEDQKTECEKMERAGVRCQSSIPKSSMDSVLVTFARGSAVLTEEGKDFLRALATTLKKREGTWKSMVIEGHADKTGTDALNQRLSRERAESVRAFLTQEYKLTGISAIGRSNHRLKDPDNPSSELNRRVEFVPDW